MNWTRKFQTYRGQDIADSSPPLYVIMHVDGLYDPVINYRTRAVRLSAYPCKSFAAARYICEWHNTIRKIE